MIRSKLLAAAAVALAVTMAWGTGGRLAQAAARQPRATVYITPVIAAKVGDKFPVCAAASTVGFDYNKLVWAHHNQGSRLTHPPGTLPQCEIYSAPSQPGFDLIQVGYVDASRQLVPGQYTSFPVTLHQ